MADWYGSSRSNYFKVKDVEKFKELCDLWNMEMISKDFDIVTDHCNKCMHNKPDKECKEFVKRIVDKCEGNKEKQKLYGFTGANNDYGRLPDFREDDTTGKEYEFDDFLNELAQTLEDGWVAVMMEAGSEKLRYVTGYTCAINSKGKVETVNISDIYVKAKELGEHITDCEY
jgi:hypothetical protein